MGRFKVGDLVRLVNYGRATRLKGVPPIGSILMIIDRERPRRLWMRGERATLSCYRTDFRHQHRNLFYCPEDSMLEPLNYDGALPGTWEGIPESIYKLKEHADGKPQG